MYGRLAALPEQTEPLQLAQLLAAFAVGKEVIRLRRLAPSLALGSALDAAFAALAQGDGASMRLGLARLDQQLAVSTGSEAQASLALRARASILALTEASARHAGYLDSGTNA
jgi:hypothetical protein